MLCSGVSSESPQVEKCAPPSCFSPQAGLRVLVLDQKNLDLDEVAYFDVFPSANDMVFRGSWSNYPYFESGEAGYGAEVGMVWARAFGGMGENMGIIVRRDLTFGRVRQRMGGYTAENGRVRQRMGGYTAENGRVRQRMGGYGREWEGTRENRRRGYAWERLAGKIPPGRSRDLYLNQIN